MSRTQDVVVARLRTVAARWWGGPPSDSGVQPASAGLAGTEWPEWDDVRARAAPTTAGAAGEQSSQGAGARGAPGDAPEDSALQLADADAGAEGDVGRSRVWLALGALTCVGALVVAGGAVVRGLPRVGPQPVAEAPSSVGLFALEDASASPSAAPSVVVHVAGEVRDPGVVTLPAGARVADAVRAAGGLRKGGRLGATNLARVLADGERVEIGAQAGAAGPAEGAGAGGPAVPVDLNTATAQQLDALPGIGPVTAAKILAWRAEHGRFSVVDELAEVPGIGPKTLEELRPHVRV